MPPKPVPIEDRFWAHVDSSGGPDACWPWTGARDPNGYGRVNVHRRGRLAHRVAFMLTHGRLPIYGAIHKCDNPPCCNPCHLTDGDQAANMADAVARGRVPRGATHPSKSQPAAWRKKMTALDVAVALDRVANGERRCDVARDFGVTPEAIGYHLSKKREATNGL